MPRDGSDAEQELSQTSARASCDHQLLPEGGAMGPPRAVFALETVEILGMGMLWTSLPILLESDTQAQRWGLVTGVASAIGLSTGALFGRLSDVHGRQLVLLLAVLMFASANIFLATAQLPLPLFESVGVAPTTLLIVGALLGRCSTTGGALRKAFVADLSAPTERTAALGRLAACGGVGFVIGPTLAGRLADIDVNLAVRAQLLLATVAVCIALTIWKSSVSATPRAEAAGTSSPSRRPSRSSTRSRSPSRRSSRSPHRATSKPAAAAETFSLTKLLSSRTVSGLMAASFFLSFGFQAFTSSFYLYCVRRFDWGPKEYGQMLSCLGVTWTTTQALVIPQLRKSGQPEPKILVVGAFLLTCGRLTLAFAYTVPLLIFGELLVVSGAATCFTITSSLLSQAVPSDQIGATMGMSSALESLCGIIAPPVVGWLTESAGVGDSAGALTAASTNGVAFLLLFWLRAKGDLTLAATDSRTKSKTA